MTHQSQMKFVATTLAVWLLLAELLAPVALAQRGGRGGGGGGRGGGAGGGGARPSLGNVGGGGARPMGGSRPSGASRPGGGNFGQAGASRPSLGSASRPNPGAGSGLSGGSVKRPGGQTGPAKPNIGTTRPSGGSGNLGSSRPSLGGLGTPTNKLPDRGQGRPSTGGLANSGGSTRPAFPNTTKPQLKPPASLKPTTRPSFPNNGNGISTLPGNGESGIASNRPGFGNVQRPVPLPGQTTRPTTRPNTRPTTLPGDLAMNNRPTTKPATRPGQINRPGIGGNNNNINNINNNVNLTRPGINNGLGVNNRPGINTRPGINNRPGTGNNNWGNSWGGWGNNSNNNVIINNNQWSNINLNRPAWDRPGNNNWNNGNWNNNNWHQSWNNNCVNPHYHHWYNGCWSGYWNSSWYAPVAWGAVGWGLGAYTANLSNQYAYVNPYYTTPVVAVSTAVPYDYSQPVVINNYVDSQSSSEPAAAAESVTAGTTPPSAELPDATGNAATAKFDEGLAAFRAQDYAKALDSFNQSLAINPGDAVVHEVRALTLFAMGNYADAAVALNSLLAAAPGMDWTTLSSLYDDPDHYTPQLRKLEEVCTQNSSDAAAHFVLAYHYLVIGAKEDAITALKVVVANQPKDVTAKKMLDALEPRKAPEAPAPGEEAALPEPSPAAAEVPAGTEAKAAEPGPETDLVGSWRAVNGKSSIDLVISEESKFTWNAKAEDGSITELSGDLISTSDTLTLETTTQGSLGGSVISKGADKWIFQPPGATEESAGIAFARVKP